MSKTNIYAAFVAGSFSLADHDIETTGLYDLHGEALKYVEGIEQEEDIKNKLRKEKGKSKDEFKKLKFKKGVCK